MPRHDPNDRPTRLTVRVSDRSQLGSLVEHLDRCGCRIGFRGGELDVHAPEAADDDRSGEGTLTSLLQAWAAFHPGAGLEIVADARHRGRAA